jgi:hypothetical protein
MFVQGMMVRVVDGVTVVVVIGSQYGRAKPLGQTHSTAWYSPLPEFKASSKRQTPPFRQGQSGVVVAVMISWVVDDGMVVVCTKVVGCVEAVVTVVAVEEVVVDAKLLDVLDCTISHRVPEEPLRQTHAQL